MMGSTTLTNFDGLIKLVNGISGLNGSWVGLANRMVHTSGWIYCASYLPRI